MKEKNHARAPDKTAISVSMPKNLKAQIKAAAEKENRSLSNYITHHLSELVQEHKESEPLRIAAEDAGTYSKPNARKDLPA